MLNKIFEKLSTAFTFTSFAIPAKLPSDEKLCTKVFWSFYFYIPRTSVFPKSATQQLSWCNAYLLFIHFYQVGLKKIKRFLSWYNNVEVLTFKKDKYLTK